jgi:hypothetical protein
MANSRELVECVAAALGWPVMTVKQHMRNLREATPTPLVTIGGRGTSAPQMSYEDAATLVCAVLGSAATQESVETVAALAKLQAVSTIPRRSDRKHPSNQSALGFELYAKFNVIQGLAAALKFLAEEEQDSRVEVVFEIAYPQHFALLRMQVRDWWSEGWTFGDRTQSRTEQIRRCRQQALREIGVCLSSQLMKSA